MSGVVVVCSECKEAFELPTAIVEAIRGGKNPLYPPKNVVAMRRKPEISEVPVVIHVEINELHELVCQANELGISVAEYIESYLQELT